MIRKTYYVAGPMRGLPKFNFPMFDEVEAALARRGHSTINPASLDRKRNPEIESAPGFADGDLEKWAEVSGFDWHRVIGADLVAIIQHADGIVLLPGWEKSLGASHEKYVAEATGKEVLFAGKSPQGHWLFTEYDPNMPGLYAVPEEPLPLVVGLVGYAQVGKDTLAAQLVEHHGFTRIAFADTLRECLYALDPMIHDDHYNPQRLQVWVNREGWDWCKVHLPEVRALLQRLGTEVGREILGNDIWVETALKKIKPGGKYVITDVRFPNELAAVAGLGGKIIRIKRDGYGPVNDHWSERALDGFDAHLELWNCDTPEYLANLVTSYLGLVTA